MHHNNPHTSAANAYSSTAASTDPRALESRVLLKSAHKLELLAQRLKTKEDVPLADIEQTLVYNRKLWQLFLEDAMNKDHPLPLDLKNNIASLAVYVFKRTHDIMVDTKPEKFKILIDINRNIAAGLAKQMASSGTTGTTPTAGTTPPLTGTDSLA